MKNTKVAGFQLPDVEGEHLRMHVEVVEGAFAQRLHRVQSNQRGRIEKP